MFFFLFFFSFSISLIEWYVPNIDLDTDLMSLALKKQTCPFGMFVNTTVPAHIDILVLSGQVCPNVFIVGGVLIFVDCTLFLLCGKHQIVQS